MNAVSETLERVSLYYRQGASDKVYQASIEPAGDRFVVNFAYGRRGATLSTGTKTTSPVDRETAVNTFTKLVAEKKAKGYTEGEDGTPYAHADKQVSGILPQLLNPVEEADLEALISDDAYCAQEKFDGRHLLIRKHGAEIEGVNKKGLIVGLPEPLLQVVSRYGPDLELDGESVGDNYHVFDLMVLNGLDVRAWPYQKRLSALMDLFLSVRQNVVRYAETAFSTKEKRALLDRLHQDRKEGIVFKQLDAPYTPGRPSSGGPQLKFKFVATVSAIVLKVNSKRSVLIGLYRGSKLVPCGNVTIPPNHDVPKIETVVEVRYLYAYRESGVLYQPVYLGPRDDVEAGECLVSQLKYKPEEEE